MVADGLTKRMKSAQIDEVMLTGTVRVSFVQLSAGSVSEKT